MHLGEALDMMSNYYKQNSLKPNPPKTHVSAFHLNTRLAKKKLWGANLKVLRTTAEVMCFSTAEYVYPLPLLYQAESFSSPEVSIQYLERSNRKFDTSLRNPRARLAQVQGKFYEICQPPTTYLFHQDASQVME